jgi:hypothetical protein
MSEEEAIKELLNMSESQLLLVPFDTVKLICQAKGCVRHTKIRDYGLHPVYYVKRFDVKWHDITKSFFTCAKHWKIYSRLIKNYDITKVQDKILDYDKHPIQKI